MRRRSGRTWAIASAGLLSGLVACRPSARQGAASSGLAVIESNAPLWSEGKGRSLASAPTVDIGGVAEAITALRLSDGRLVVAQADPFHLGYFAPDGRHLYDAGGGEDGPEALESILQVDLGRGDTVAVFDFARHEVVFFDANGGRAGGIPVASAVTPAGANGLLPRGLAPDGRYLLQADETRYPFPGGAGAILPDSTRVYFLGRDGRLTDSTARVFEGESFGFAATTAAGNPLVIPLARPLGALLHVATGSSGLWVGDGRRWELWHLDLRGQVDRTVRLVRPLAAVTPALRDTFIARFRARRLGTDKRGLDRQFADRIGDAPFPDTLPAFAGLFVGADSTLWLQHAGLLEGNAGDGSLDWTLIGADGRWLGDLTMPPHFRPTAAGRDWVAGLARAADGTAHVQLYPLQER